MNSIDNVRPFPTQEVAKKPPEQTQLDAMINEGGSVPPSEGAVPDAETRVPDSSSTLDEEGSDEPRPTWLRHRVERFSRKLGIRYMRRLGRRSSRSALSRSMAAVPERMRLVANQTQLMIEAVDDFKRGEYHQMPWHSLALMAGALLYTVSPADVVPDALPFLGTLDDLAVVALVVRFMQRDLRAYCRYKGYPEAEYF